MEGQRDRLSKWLAELEGKHPAEWALLPDIGLYMDQVQTYIDRQLGLYRRDDQERLLTPAMINNYIKDSLIPRAEAKKYNPTHLALLIMIATLKQVLSIQNINHLLSSYRDAADVAAFYERFLEVQRRSLSDCAAQVVRQMADIRLDETADPGSGSQNPDGNRTVLRNMALELTIEARTRILIAEKMLDLLNEPHPEEPADRKKDKSR